MPDSRVSPPREVVDVTRKLLAKTPVKAPCYGGKAHAMDPSVGSKLHCWLCRR